MESREQELLHTYLRANEILPVNELQIDVLNLSFMISYKTVFNKILYVTRTVAKCSNTSTIMWEREILAEYV